MRVSLGMLLLLLLGPAGIVAAETHPFSIHDMLAMDRISDPQVSPDGTRVVFGLRSTDLEANRGRSDLWSVGIDGADLRRLTSHPTGESNPRFHPDGGSLFFLSSRSESSQVWRIPLDGGEAVQLTELPLEVTSLAVAPDGKSLVVSMEVFPDCEKSSGYILRHTERLRLGSTKSIIKPPG